jgi:hypothetical protein
MTAVIILVCVYDIFLTVKYHDSIISLEQNPVAMWFVSTRTTVVSRFTDDLNRQHNIVHYSVDVSMLVLVKILGMLSGSVLLQYLVSHCQRRIAVPVVSTVFLFQVSLLVYLVFV